MTSPTGLLDFYILEATEYVDQLDTLVAASASARPDAARLLSSARALRGASTMARLAPLAELALGVERLARALGDARVEWAAPVHGVLVATVDEFRLLIREVRTFGPAQERRAQERARELRALVPEAQPAASSPAHAAADPSFFAVEVEAIASSLDGAVGNPRDPRPMDRALARVRALRGIAALRDLPPLADVSDAIERAALRRPTSPGAALPAPVGDLLIASAAVLRRAASDLRQRGRPDTSAPEIAAFVAASAALANASAAPEAVVPVASLFFTDSGPHVISRAHAPPTTPDGRFRTEVLPHTERLRHLVAEARAANDPVARDRAVRELRAGLAEIRALATSYGFGLVARFFGDPSSNAELLDPVMLASLEDAARRIAASDQSSMSEIVAALDALRRGRAVDQAIGVGLGPIADAPSRTPASSPTVGRARTPAPSARSISQAVTPAVSTSAPATPAPRKPTPGATPHLTTPTGNTDPRFRTVTPTGSELRELLQSGIAGFDDLEVTPLSTPAQVDEEAIVSMDDLVYRGRSALERARELRDRLRDTPAPDRATLDELYDLLDLAARE
jgi:chemotaxis protein histidine kinase CheA